MSLPPTVAIDALDRDGHGLRAEFAWRGDRYGQIIFAVHGAEATPLLEASSATSLSGFPGAAPLQSVVTHKLDAARSSLLLTGAGDGRYWSATVTPLTDVRFALLGFDVACRRPRDASMPVVAYRLAAGVTATMPGPDDITLRTRDGHEFKLGAAAMPTSISTENISTCRASLTGQGIVIEALGSPHVSTGATVQWRYEISAARPR